MAITRSGAPEDQVAGADDVGARVIERTAARRRIVPDVGGIEEPHRDRALHAAYAVDLPPLGQQFADPLPLRMIPENEGFLDVPTRPVAGPDERRDLRRRQAQRFLAQHVFAGCQCAYIPFEMQVVGQRDVDRIDVGIGEDGVTEPWLRAICSDAATCRAFAGSREPIATTVALAA